MDYTDESDRIKRAAEKKLLLEKELEDKPYTIILTVLGIACIIFATVMTIDRGLSISKEGGTLYVIGLVLVLGAYFWQQQDSKNIDNINKKIDDDDGDAYTEKRVR